jgi:hypothetical protein
VWLGLPRGFFFPFWRQGLDVQAACIKHEPGWIDPCLAGPKVVSICISDRPSSGREARDNIISTCLTKKAGGSRPKHIQMNGGDSPYLAKASSNSGTSAQN